MASSRLKLTAILTVVLSALLIRIEFPRMVSLGLGLNKRIELLSEFPYTCRRIYHEHLKACEDMWLSESTRQLFLACSEPLTRTQWMPNMGHFNLSGRNPDDSIMVLNLDEFEVNADIKPRILTTKGFPGTNGDGRLDLSGMSGVDDENGSIRLWVVNMKPSVDPVTGEFLNQAKDGANTTIELFRTGRDAENLEHVRTFAHAQIASPNRIAAIGGKTNNFYFTNDHGTAKVGLKHHLSPILATGDVSFCNDTGCRQVASGLKFPNGLSKGQDGLIYVPSSLLGRIDVFKAEENGNLVKSSSIDAGYSVDNLSVDRAGTIFAAAIPNAIKFFAANKSPYSKDTPTLALRIVKKAEGKYEVNKAVEDGLGEILPGATTVLHDAKTGRLFFSSVFAPYIAICNLM